MYLPLFPSDAADVLCNAIDFDGICQIRSENLLLASRIASLTLVGWRIFRFVFADGGCARESPRMRDADCDRETACVAHTSGLTVPDTLASHGPNITCFPGDICRTM
jgi:hypothetical protein